jgi:hypothetical protein
MSTEEDSYRSAGDRTAAALFGGASLPRLVSITLIYPPTTATAIQCDLHFLDLPSLPHAFLAVQAARVLHSPAHTIRRASYHVYYHRNRVLDFPLCHQLRLPKAGVGLLLSRRLAPHISLPLLQASIRTAFLPSSWHLPTITCCTLFKSISRICEPWFNARYVSNHSMSRSP